MQEEKEDRFARVLKVFDAEVDKTKKEMDRLDQLHELEEDDHMRQELSEQRLYAECDYRDALAKRNQLLSID